MSANKKATVQINRREYERLRQLERSSMFPPIAQTHGFSSAIEDTLTNQMDELERRQNDYQRIISSMGDEIQLMETEASEALVTQQQLFLAEIESVERGLTLTTEELLTRQEEFFTNVIRTSENHYNNQLDEIQETLSQYKNDLQFKQSKAYDMIHELEDIWTWHVQEYNWVQFLSEKAQTIEENLDLMNRNYDMGSYESSILVSQQSLKLIQNARIEIEQKESEWSLLCETVKQEASRLFQLAVDHRTVMPVDVHGNLLASQAEINVNYWTHGALKTFIDTMRTILIQVRDHKDTMTIKGLREWLENRLPELEEELLDIVMEARENVIDSQLRTNITNVIIATMKQQGFKAIQIEDHGNEIRQSNRLVMRHMTGDEVYIELTPEMSQIGKNYISIESAELQSMSQYELDQRRKQIAEKLESYGVDIEVENAVIINDEPIDIQLRRGLRGDTGQISSQPKPPGDRNVPTFRRSVRK